MNPAVYSSTPQSETRHSGIPSIRSICARLRGVVLGAALFGAMLFDAPPASGQILEEVAEAPSAQSDGASFLDPEVAEAAYFQPPALNQPAEAPRIAPRTTARSSRQRLASVPNMFGDVGMSLGTVRFIDPQETGSGSFDVPGAGGSRRVKIGENNSPIPTDRYFFMYNHFHNAYEFNEQLNFPPSVVQRQESIDRFTLGIEKTFFDEWWSVELRVPVVAALDVEGETFAARGGSWGNLAVIIKRLLYADDYIALAAGLGIDIPTGSDFESELNRGFLRVENDALHLLPYLGVVVDPGAGMFFSAYMQMDIAASGNDVIVGPIGQPGQSAGRFTEQNLMYFDVAAGYWLYDNPYSESITGIAAMLEFHYTTAVQDSDTLAIQSPFTTALITTPGNRFDVVNVSAGANFELGEWSNLRVAGVFPIGDGPDRRFFDAEVQVQFNQRY